MSVSVLRQFFHLDKILIFAAFKILVQCRKGVIKLSVPVVLQPAQIYELRYIRHRNVVPADILVCVSLTISWNRKDKFSWSVNIVRLNTAKLKE